jgi:hypothetical protein
MKTNLLKIFLAIGVLFSLQSCKNEASLQQYFVDSMEKPHFMSFDVSAGMLNIAEGELDAKQKEALQSLKKLNVLIFKKNDSNSTDFETERASVDKILKSGDFTELMKVKTPFGKGSLRYYGDEDAIDEVVLYGSNSDKGFVLMRILGDNMNPANLMQMVQALEKSNYKGEGLGSISEMFGS